jgi:hypothetical protein
MQTTRIEAELDAPLSPDNSCSVFWLVPDAEGELEQAMNAVAETSAMAAWGFIGAWERSKLREATGADVARSSRMSGQFVLGDTRMHADLLTLSSADDDWFWAYFGKAIRPHQIAAALVPSAARWPGGWTFAGLQLVLTAAALQARPGASHGFVLGALEQAFLGETLAAGGIAVTRLRAELLGPGIALTASGALIDAVSSRLPAAGAIDPLLVERSRSLSGDW